MTDSQDSSYPPTGEAGAEPRPPCSQSEERYRLIFERSPIGIFCYDPALRITEFNESFVRILRSKPERLQNLDMTRLTDQSVMPALRAALLGENGHYLGPYRPTTGTGEIHVSLRCLPLLDESGLVEGGIATVEDITERRGAELEQERYVASLSFLASTALEFLDLPPDGDIYGLVANRLSQLVGDAVILVNSYDPATGTTETKVAWGLESSTKRLLRILGRDAVGMRLAIDLDAATRLRSGRLEQVQGVHALTFGRLPKRVCTALEELFTLGEIWSMGFTARGELLGSVCVLLKNGASLRDPAAMEAFVSQASVALLRKRAEDARKESEDKAAYAFAASPDSILIARLEDGAIVEANESFFASVGRSRDETLGKRAADLQKWTRREDRRTFLRVLERDGLVSNFDTLLETGSGQAVSALVSGRIIEMGGEKCVLTIARDISDRKRFEEELRASENTYRTIFENKGTATVIIEADGTISLANSKALELLGFPREEIEGKRKWSDFVLEPDLRRMKKLHALRQVDPAAAPKNYEFRGFGSDGQAKNVMINIDVIPGQSKSVASFLDITDQKRAQEEIQRAAKLESLGLLAGGIAHDFNNLLGALLGNLSLARDELQSARSDTEQLASYLEASQKAVLRARDLTQQLLTFSKGGAPVKRVASLAGVLEDSVHFALSGSQHQPHLQIDPALWATRMDSGQMSQVIQNLVLNAAQSMSEPGTITVTAANLTVRPTGYSLPLLPGKHVRVQVVDHGCGIPPEDLPRVFDPFFTTRPESGSGLGLATSYRIVKQHDGLMTLDSTPGEGSTFAFYLPAVEGAAADAPPDESRRTLGSGSILLVDDEEHLRTVVARMLERLGYSAVTAASAEQGYGLFMEAWERKVPFDLVITDLTMPGGGGGVDLARKILGSAPRARIVATSGYATDPVMSDFRDWGFVGRLPKPFTLEELSEGLSRLDNAPRPPAIPAQREA